MGLSVAYGTISRHGGDISVSSKLQKGSTFTIRLPVSQKSGHDEGAEAYQTSSKSATILVIDDDSGTRDVFSEILARDGHTLDIASSGTEGLSVAQQKDYDVVITDLGMRDISGRDVARVVKRTSSKTLVVLITGWGVQLNKHLGHRLLC